MKPKKVIIIAGEASGDLHGSRLVLAMRESDPTLEFWGIGGQAMQRAGVRLLMNAAQLSVVGITEAFSKLPQIIMGIYRIKHSLAAIQPDLLILIDFPDFNLYLAACAKKLAIPVLYYISPQIWAWRSGRIAKIKKRVDHMAVILPFEEDIYRRHHIPVTFVGHPLMDAGLPSLPAATAFSVDDPPVVSLLPGSRDREVAKHLPVMIQAANLLGQRLNGLKFMVSCAPSARRRMLEEIIDQYKGPYPFELVGDDVSRVFLKSCLALAVSGTVTLQAAIYGTPCVIVYKVSPVSYWLGRRLIRVDHIGLVNLIAGRQLMPELIQDAVSPESLSAKAYEMLTDRAGLEKIRAELVSIRDRLGPPGASARVAELALTLMDRRGDGTATHKWLNPANAKARP
jgi:lipid-A-disaccharide synthase